MRRAFTAALFALVGVAFSAMGAQAQTRGANEPQISRSFIPGPCAVDLAKTGRTFQCGVLIAPETRGSGDGRRVALPVAILKAEHASGLPPVIYLHGGPGGGVVGGLGRGGNGLGTWPRWLGHDQDVIFFDQRGGKLASPSLDCGELNLTDAGPDSDGTVASLKACAQRWAASGVDLSRYNASEGAKDVQDLRAALKLPVVDLFGVSYGTRIALEIVRDQPQGVRAVVLDSLWPPEAKWAEDGAAPVARAVRLILRLCREDPTCTAPNKATLETRMDAMAVRWLAAPQGPAGGRLYPVDDFSQYLMDAAYSGPEARALPGVFAKLLAGDFAPLAAYDAERSEYNEAQHLTHLCKEQFPFESRAKTVTNAGSDPYAQALARSLTRYFDVCEGYPVGKPLAGDDRPVVSSLPILIVNAGIDPGCPPELAQAAVKRLSHGQLVIFPFATHGVTRNSPCAAGIARAFLQQPGRAADTTCVATEQTGFHFGG